MDSENRLFRKSIQRLLAGVLDNNTDSGQVLRGAALSFIILFLGFIATYANQVFLARFSGPYEFGLYAYAWTYATGLSMLLPLGFNLAVLKLIPSYSAQSRWSHVKGVLLMTPVLVFAVSLVIGAMGAAGVYLIGASIPAGYAWPLTIAFAITPFMAILTLFHGTGRALGLVGIAFAPKSIGVPLAVIAAAGIWVAAGKPLKAVDIMVFSLAACLLFAVVQGWLLHKDLPGDISNAPPAFEVRAWLRISLPLLFASGMGLILNYADIIMIGYFMTPEDVAVYHAAARTAVLISGFLIAVNALAAPKIARLHAEGRMPDLQKLISRITHWIFWPSVLAALIALFFGDFVLAIFGAGFAAGYVALSVLAMGQLVNAGAGPVGYLMTMTGHHDASALVFGCSAVLNIILNAVLIPAFGITGAAVATAITMACWNLWFILLVRKRLNINCYVFAAARYVGIQREKKV